MGFFNVRALRGVYVGMCGGLWVDMRGLYGVLQCKGS